MRTLEGTYGCRRIQACLERRGVRVDGATILSIMRELGLQAAQLWARLRATVPADDLDERPDLVRRNFTAESPGCKWCGDIAYVSTWAGFVCLVSCDRPGLLHQESRGLCDGRPHAHFPGARPLMWRLEDARSRGT
ncbi:IS3 family transposase [Actinomyces gerencseriae]|uniref:IS3 family transposase n=1 Tax=Actinomyces gerencseriae TaxID=52769 RepID=UPI003C6C091A